MIGEDRMIVSDVAGTTRDSVDIPFVSDGRACEFVDTAGVRRRTRITDTVERFSVNSSLKTTTKADVTLYVIDARGRDRAGQAAYRSFGRAQDALHDSGEQD